MAVIRFRPAMHLSDRKETNRLLEKFCGKFPAKGECSSTIEPDADVKETDSEVLLSIETPGMEQNDMKITVRDRVLVLRGEKKEELNAERASCLIGERSYGNVERSFILPANIDTSNISALYRNGVLYITLPKVGVSQPKDIQVKVP